MWRLGLVIAAVVGSPPCPQYGCHQHYLPAPPGKTPPCAKYGQTYCETIDTYPAHVIQYLVERWYYDYNTLFASEKRDNYRPRPEYGPPQYQHNKGYPSGPKQPSHQSSLPYYIQPPAPQNVNSSYSQTHGGYPDRQYPLGNPQQYLYSDDPGYIYSAILQPDVTPYDPDHWWKRYSRSDRKKRQLGGTTLCPTSSQFIMPRAALNNQGNWKFVVNIDQNQRYTQLVRSETCISSQCNGICSLPNGYSSRCEQQYVQKRLVALDGGGDSLYTDVFWLPHCCLCQITQNNR